MQSIHGLAIHSPESNKSSRWSLMDLLNIATCSIHWAVLWSTEYIKIRQNQAESWEGFWRIWGYMPHRATTTLILPIKTSITAEYRPQRQQQSSSLLKTDRARWSKHRELSSLPVLFSITSLHPHMMLPVNPTKLLQFNFILFCVDCGGRSL